MGAGKSTLGRRLAEELGWSFVDLDERLAREHGPVADQIRLEGEPVFRARERELALACCDGARRVLALGGGAWADPILREALPRHYLTVWLRAPLGVLAARAAGSDRPLWDDRVAERLAAREPVYALADRVLDNAGDDPTIAVRALVALVGEGA